MTTDVVEYQGGAVAAPEWERKLALVKSIREKEAADGNN